MKTSDLAAKLDLANHHASATPNDVIKLCREVILYGFNAAFVNPAYITLAKKELAGRAKVGTAISFPLGQDTVEAKIYAAKEAAALGADELDVVPNNGLLLTDDIPRYTQEITSIIEAARAERPDIVVKFIIETGFFTGDIRNNPLLPSNGKELIVQASQAIVASGADFVKICSGMGPRGASVEDLKLVREAVGNRVRIKVAGGIDTLAEAQEFFTAGADRIGTSKAVKIIQELQESS